MTFDKYTMVFIRNFSRKENTRVISFLIFYENINRTIFKVLGSVVYSIMEKQCVLIIFV